MTKTTRSLIVSAFVTLMLVLSVMLGTFLAHDSADVNETDLSFALTADEGERLELIDENGKSSYTIIFSTDTITQDYDLSEERYSSDCRPLLG